MKTLLKIIKRINEGVEPNARFYAHLVWGQVVAFFVAIVNALLFLRVFGVSRVLTAFIAIAICFLVALGFEILQKKKLGGENTTREFWKDTITSWFPAFLVVPVVMALMGHSLLTDLL